MQLFKVLSYVVVLGGLGIVNALAQTASISGKIENGTTSKPAVAEWVTLVVAGQGGMQTLQQFEKVSKYEFPNLKPQQGIPYLIRASYKGVVYTKATMVVEAKRYESNVSVYETTDKWTDINVRVPHIVLARDEDVLQVEQTFEINNSGKFTFQISDQAKPTFRFQLPAGAQIKSLTTSLNSNMPITQSHFKFEDGEGINYSLLPGTTQIQVTYAVGYPDRIDFASKWYYNIAECNVFITPPDVTVKSERFKKIEDRQMAEHNFIIYSATNIKAGESPTLSLSGGSSIKKEEEEGSIKAVENAVQKVVWVVLPFLIGCLLIILYWSVTRTGASRAVEQKEQLLREIAELDDRQANETIPDYEQKRKKLKKELYHLLTETEK